MVTVAELQLSPDVITTGGQSQLMVWMVFHFEILIIFMSKKSSSSSSSSSSSFSCFFFNYDHHAHHHHAHHHHHHHLSKASFIFLPSVALDIVFLTGYGLCFTLLFLIIFISLSFSIMFNFSSSWHSW